jgi:hypothetical protein
MIQDHDVARVEYHSTTLHQIGNARSSAISGKTDCVRGNSRAIVAFGVLVFGIQEGNH